MTWGGRSALCGRSLSVQQTACGGQEAARGAYEESNIQRPSPLHMRHAADQTMRSTQRAPQHVRLLEGSGPSCTQHPHYDTQPNMRCEAGDRLRGRAGGHSGIGEAGWPWQRHSMHAVLPDECRIHSTVNGARCVRRHRRDKIVRKSTRGTISAIAPGEELAGRPRHCRHCARCQRRNQTEGEHCRCRLDLAGQNEVTVWTRSPGPPGRVTETCLAGR